MNLIKSTLLFFALLALSCSSEEETLPADSSDTDLTDTTNEDCTNTIGVFSISLDPTTCLVDIQTELGTISQYSETVSGDERTINVNGIANHLVGEFPNGGNPNTISIANNTYTIPLNPAVASNSTSGQGHIFGVLFSGVVMDPYTAEFFVGSTGTINMEWNITALQSTTALGLDCNNAHVQPTGRYHYHGTPSNYLDGINVTGNEMVKVGYAGDGFPIYYKYGYDDEGISIVAIESGYELKMESRGGDGVSAPDGCPDGYYFQDYEYVEGISLLDECNGRFGKTPESDEEYYYVITDNFPSSPLCFSGTPDQSFRLGN